MKVLLLLGAVLGVAMLDVAVWLTPGVTLAGGLAATGGIVLFGASITAAATL